MAAASADARTRLSILLLCLVAACKASTAGSIDSELELGRRFVQSLEFRRSALEQSLAVRDNGDARARLARYGVAGEWEALPVVNPLVAPVVELELPVFERLWSGELDGSQGSLLELGRRAFEEWPAQRLPQMAQLLGPPSDPVSLARERLTRVGAWRDARGRVGGLVWVRHGDSTTEPALTCASCHSRPDAAGRLVHGPASDFDLGALVGESWGAGHVDVTVDGSDNPVAVPDLRATRHQRRLHHSGNLYNSLPALAVRTETLLITASSEVVRPPREIAFAIAYYVWSLGSSSSEPEPSTLFRERCGYCHSGPTGAGELVALADVGTDGAAARSSARGTGGYRAPSLYRVSQRARLTHLGWPLTVEQFLDPSRQAAWPGHPFGLDLGPEQRHALVRELTSW